MFKRSYKTKPSSRQARRKARGYEFYANKSEEACAQLLAGVGRSFSKRGYPDLTVYNSDGSIFGFIEIKPNQERKLKKEQQAFGDFCLARDIPFIRWCPEDGLEKLQEFLGDQ